MPAMDYEGAARRTTAADVAQAEEPTGAVAGIAVVAIFSGIIGALAMFWVMQGVNAVCQ